MAGKNPTNPCPVPGCNKNVAFNSKYGVCFHHEDIFQAITYYMKKAQGQAQAVRKVGGRPGDKITPSGIFLP
jgi:hypothetical protein